jgi:hypothetical protein
MQGEKAEPVDSIVAVLSNSARDNYGDPKNWIIGALIGLAVGGFSALSKSKG